MSDLLALAEAFNDAAAMLLRRNPRLGDTFAAAMTRKEYGLLRCYEEKTVPRPADALKRAELVAKVLDRALHGRKARRRIRKLAAASPALYPELKRKAPALARLCRPAQRA